MRRGTLERSTRAPRRVARWAACSSAALLLVPGSAIAGGFEVPDQSAVAGAAGGAGAGRRGDPSSAWYDPAEVADGRGFRAGLGVVLALPRFTAEGLEEPWQTASTVRTVLPPPHLHVSYAHRQWAVGTYVGLSHGSTVEWPSGWWGRFETLKSAIHGIRAAPFVALALGGGHGLVRAWPDLRIALGAHLDTLRFESRRALDFIDQEGRVHVLLWGVGVGGDASLYWQATPKLGVGFAYRSRDLVGLDGDADFTVPDAFVGRAPDQHATASLIVPDRLSLGAAWQEDPFGVFLELDATLWSVRERLAVDFESPDTTDIDTPARWHDSVQVRLGGELSPVRRLRLRAGAFYDMEVGPADTLAPSSPDMTRLGATIGVGGDLVPGVGADAYYAYVGFVGRESTGPDAALARYSGSLHLVGLTLRVVLGAPQQEVARD